MSNRLRDYQSSSHEDGATLVWHPQSQVHTAPCPAGQRWESVSRRTMDFVRRKPEVVLIAGLALGVTLGWLIKRR